MHNIQLVKIQPEERLAASSELNPASCLVTGCGEARGMGYWAATQVKGLSPEIFIVPEADVVVLTEGSTLIADSPIGTWQGDASPAGSETVARYQTDIMGTRETQSVLLAGVCAIKPINGKTVQTTLWESDQFIVPVKQGNACRGKGLAGARWPGRGTPSILRDGQGVSTKLWSITLRERRGCTPEEPDEGKLQVRFCEGAHSNLGAITSKKRCAMGSTRQLVESEERERTLKKSIAEIASIQNNPDAEARNKIAELEGTIAGLKEKLERTEKNNKDTIEELTKTLKEEEENLTILEESFDNYKGGKGVKSLLYLLLGDIRKRAAAQKWFNRAYGEGKKGNTENVIEYYDKAIELNPEYADAYNNRGATYYDLTEYEAAISDWNKAIELNPEDATAYYNRGNAYRNLKDYEKAISDYNKAIELNPEYADAYNNRGFAYDDLKNYEKAISDYDKAIELNPEYADAYNNRGAAYYDLKDYEKAISDWNKAIELNPEDATAYYNRGFAYDDLKDYKKAISDYDKAIELNPGYADAYNNRGLVYRNIKDYENAISGYNKAIESNPEYVDAYENLSELYIITGNHKSALEAIKKVLSLSLEIKDRALCLYLECIAKKMLQIDISDCENELNEILKREFKLTTWSFAEIKSWLEDISNDQKAFIIEKTERLKEHKR